MLGCLKREELKSGGQGRKRSAWQRPWWSCGFLWKGLEESVPFVSLDRSPKCCFTPAYYSVRTTLSQHPKNLKASVCILLLSLISCDWLLETSQKPPVTSVCGTQWNSASFPFVSPVPSTAGYRAGAPQMSHDVHWNHTPSVMIPWFPYTDLTFPSLCCFFFLFVLCLILLW